MMTGPRRTSDARVPSRPLRESGRRIPVDTVVPTKGIGLQESRKSARNREGPLPFAILREVVHVIRDRNRADVNPELPLVAPGFIASQHRYKGVIGPNYRRRLHQFLLELIQRLEQVSDVATQSQRVLRDK